MAEIVVSALLTTVFEKLASIALKQVVRSHGIHSELKKLERKLTHIQALLIDASHKEITDEAVKLWLNGLQHLAYDIDDILDDLATEAMHRELTQESGATTSKVRKLIPTCCTNFPLSNRLRHKLDDITSRLEDLENRKLDLGLMVKEDMPKNKSRRNETSLPDSSSIVGRQGDKEIYLQKLLGGERCDQNFTIVPIVGMGGVGKTTLARLLYNETQVKDHFEVQAWVCVSDELDIFKISQTIYQVVTRETKKFTDLNELQIALTEQLKDKRFLLVLDDVWSENYDDWENLVRPCHVGAHGSRIVMTTRKEQLLKKLGFNHLDHLETLSHENALSLFTLHALGVDNFDSQPTLKAKGEGIVKKCGGLPLALKALGRLLRMKEDKEDWDVILNSEIWDLESDDVIVPALRLSYHDLPARLKQLFAYCSLFPKDFLFDQEDLILLWMAEGYLNQLPANMTQESLGHEYFEKLLSRSFFQHAPNDESLFVMHDLMNDLATFVARDYFLRFENPMGMANETIAKYRHMSFIREEYVSYKKFEPFKQAESLKTLLAVSSGVVDPIYQSFHLSNSILFDLLPGLPLLRVLSLSGFAINEVPEFFGSLKHLRYLNLSQTEIKKLPENVGNLYNLQTLIVFGCWRLSKLPKSFLKLKKLRHFDIRGTPLLKKMPMGIGELESLHTLTKIIIQENDGFAITDFKKLKNLHGKISIEGLHKVQSAMHAQEANSSLKRFTELKLKWDNVFDGSRREALEKEVLNQLTPHGDKLKRLGVESYGGIEFPNWVGDPFRWLADVSIQGCIKCISLPPLGQLPSLKKLRIEGMHEVEAIGLEFLGSNGLAFPSLEILEFGDMPNWKVWSANSVVVDVFPCLQEIHIENCPKLVDVSLKVLPLLRVLKIAGCSDGMLTCLVQVASSITKLEIKSIAGLTDMVWRGVIEHLGAVEEVKIEGCDKMKYLWESEAKASMNLVNLKKFEVSQCADLVRLGEKEDGGNFGSSILTSLQVLDISICHNMENCCCPNNIESLRIFACESLTSISFPTATEGGQNLKSLDLFKCNKLTEKITNTSMPMLEYVSIFCWPTLKSITELSNSIHLTRLIINGCQSLESFPNLQLPNLTSLKDLTIVECPSMDESFPRGLWPPNLRRLAIGGLKKPISEWGPQNFPSSLVELSLSNESVSNFSQLAYLLPSSLTLLHIRDFEKLESLAVGLHHLTSLEHLIIDTCPKLKHLPEKLLPPLLRLVIFKCPYVKKRSSGRGSYYWPLISHIPYIDISDDLFGLSEMRDWFEDEEESSRVCCFSNI